MNSQYITPILIDHYSLLHLLMRYALFPSRVRELFFVYFHFSPLRLNIDIYIIVMSTSSGSDDFSEDEDKIYLSREDKGNSSLRLILYPITPLASSPLLPFHPSLFFLIISLIQRRSKRIRSTKHA